jgi:hypothetical protein
MRHGRLQCIEAVVERQQGVLAKGDGQGFSNSLAKLAVGVIYLMSGASALQFGQLQFCYPRCYPARDYCEIIIDSAKKTALTNGLGPV